MKPHELRKGMIITLPDTGEKWRLTSQKCHIFAKEDQGSLKRGDKIHVDNNRRNKWMAKRVTDEKEQLFCFDIGVELPEGVVEPANAP